MVFFSTIESMYYLLPLIGLLVGLFGTLLGGGGGFIFLPVLTLVIHQSAQVAVITTLVATLPICIVGSLGHLKNGNINIKAGLFFIVLGIAGAFLGAYITKALASEHLKVYFGIYSIIIALFLVYTTWKDASKSRMIEKDRLLNNQRLRRIKSGFLAFTGGIITGTFGTSGSAPIIVGLFNLNIAIKTAIGTSLLVVLSNTLFAIGAHAMISSLDLTVVIFLTIGSVVGAIWGAKLLLKTKIEKSAGKLKYLYALAMLLMGLLMIK